MHDGARIDDKGQLFNNGATARAIDAHAGDAGDPGRHVALLAERRRNAEPDVFRHRAAPCRLFSDASEYGSLPSRAPTRVPPRAPIPAPALPHAPPAAHRI